MSAPARVPIKLTDMRHESAFYAGLVPAGDNKLHAALLILKNQVVYPLVQGFAWALLKDWLIVTKLFASNRGRQFGLQFRSWLNQWMEASFYGGRNVTE